MIQKLVKPAEFAEKQLIKNILSGTYNPGDTLPAERALAQQLGVTRPTLREVLQRLSKEGWVCIRHGKPTRVNHYLENGGLAILSGLVRNGNSLSGRMVEHLLEVRAAMLPDIAEKAAEKNTKQLLFYIGKYKDLKDSAKDFAEFDWQVQIQMVKLSGNPVFNMIFNDFAPIYDILGRQYFSIKTTRDLTLDYYHDLMVAIKGKAGGVKPVVEKMMIRTRQIWQTIS